MSCPINTSLSEGKGLAALSEQDQMVAMADFLFVFGGGIPALVSTFQSISEKDQWICIAVLLGQVADSIVDPPNTDVQDPVVELSDASDFQGASQYDGTNAILQLACNAQ